MSGGASEGSRVGSQFGPYHLRRLIGAGGFGEVYEAEDTAKDRIVALKLLPEAMSRDDVFRKRMQREAHAAGRLQEPHVVPIHDYGEIDGLLFVDMRLIDGVDLHSILVDEGPLAPARAVAIVRQVASALDAAHEVGVMHRDVKPENILITRDDFAYLVDFGLATAASDERLTQMGTMVGTFNYMAPERFRNKDVTSSSDIYSLACVLHECLTGSRPYKANSLSSLITSHLTAPAPRPSQVHPGVPIGLDRVIARGMAKEPENRYATAGELAVAALDALTTTDQRRAANILERSEEGAPPTGPAFGPPPQPPASGPNVAPSGWWSGSGSGPQYMPAQSPWTGFQPAAGSPTRGPKVPPWLIGVGVAVILAVVVAVVLVTTGVLSTGGSGTTTTTPSVPPSGYTADDDNLIGLITHAGYQRSTCTPQHPAKDNALSTLDCDALDGGPDSATFWLYGDQSPLDDQFKNITSAAQLQTCPNGIQSPGTWHYTSSPTQAAGQLACGTQNGNAVVIWTENSKNFVAVIHGTSIDDLYKWWQQKS
ncbi:MAG: serine/threonine protein kinase [Mycobacteriaceae bacterium]|nr:serine/threonine protein kinase [Mycobacteriaceae bacterium]